MSFQDVYAKLERVFCTELVFGGWCIFKTEKHIILERALPDRKNPVVRGAKPKNNEIGYPETSLQPQPEPHEKAFPGDARGDLDDQINFLRLFQLRSVASPSPIVDKRQSNRILNEQLQTKKSSVASNVYSDPTHPQQPSCFNPHLIHDNSNIIPSASDSNNNSGKASGAQCVQCGVTFVTTNHLSRHVRSIHLGIKYDCPHCVAAYSRPYLLKNHIALVHKEVAGSAAGVKDVGKDGSGGDKKVAQTADNAKRKGKRGSGGGRSGSRGGDAAVSSDGAVTTGVKNDKPKLSKTIHVSPPVNIKKEKDASSSIRENNIDSRDVSKTKVRSLPFRQRTQTAPLSAVAITAAIERRTSSRTDLTATPSTSSVIAATSKSVAVKIELKSTSTSSSASPVPKLSNASNAKSLRQLQPLQQALHRKRRQLPRNGKLRKRRILRTFPLVKPEETKSPPVLEKNCQAQTSSSEQSLDSSKNIVSVPAAQTSPKERPSKKPSPSKTRSLLTQSPPSNVRSHRKRVEIDIHDDSLTFMLCDANANNVEVVDDEDAADASDAAAGGEDRIDDRLCDPSKDPSNVPSVVRARKIKSLAATSSDVDPSTTHSPASSSTASASSSTASPKKRTYAPSIIAQTEIFDGKKHWLCPHCRLPCKSMIGLQKHLIEHKGKRRFLCQKCLMVFESNGKLDRHTVVHERRALSMTF